MPSRHIINNETLFNIEKTPLTMKNKAGISPVLSVYPFFVTMTIFGEKDTEFCKAFVRTLSLLLLQHYLHKALLSLLE